jgi:subtilisin family serine protease
VLAVRPVIDYSIELSETVPYIGATAVQNLGFTGAGVRVAVLDSGIDYTHRNLGGSGSAADYTAAFGTSLDDRRNQTLPDPKLFPNLFPTEKVVGGYDFIGEHWPNADGRDTADGGCGKDATGNALVCLKPDPNPIACGLPTVPIVGGCDGTHGTHVSDIIAGRSKDGKHVGAAPGAQLYALKVCSSVSTACSGVALMNAMEFALDPNGDGDLSDAVDVINMSLGSNYGQVEDDLTLASENAVRLGVVVATAAGNAGDKPYIVSSPSIGPGVISVAQTQVPGAKFFPLKINSPASIAGTYNNTATVDWAPITTGFTGDVAYVGRGCPAGSILPGPNPPPNPDDPYLADPAGKVALIDRGACSISLKVDRASKAGATAVLIGLVAAGDAVSFSFGGGDQQGFKQTLVIIRDDAKRIKDALVAGATVNVTVSDSAHAPSLVKSMASTSARGPSMSFQTVKPEIGAPGASVSAVAGTGNGEAAFGGTSGATPMIAGSAALLLERYPHASPFEIKARLMNTAETGILTAPGLLPGQVAPVSRIGAGEVRVDRAMSANTFALSLENESAAVSFGYAALDRPRTFNRKVLVFNRAGSKRTYSVSAGFRDPSNPAIAAGAATLQVPSTLHVSKGGVGVLEVRLSVDPSKLNPWTINGGPQGGNGQLLNTLELDGQITISDAQDTIHVPWHMLPHRAADVSSRDDDVDLRDGSGTVTLRNTGAIAGRFDVFARTGTSKKSGAEGEAGDGRPGARVQRGEALPHHLAAFDRPGEGEERQGQEERRPDHEGEGVDLVTRERTADQVAQSPGGGAAEREDESRERERGPPGDRQPDQAGRGDRGSQKVQQARPFAEHQRRQDHGEEHLRLLHDCRQPRGHADLDGPEEHGELPEEAEEREARVDAEGKARPRQEQDGRDRGDQHAQPAEHERRDADQPQLDDDEVHAPEQDHCQGQRDIAGPQSVSARPRCGTARRGSGAGWGWACATRD